MRETPELNVTGGDRANWGPTWQADLLSQYKDYLASADAVSTRRNTANKHMLAINTVFVGGVSYAGLDSTVMALVSALLGFVICFAWAGLIESHRSLNSAKFRVIQAMEKHLPAAPYTAEEQVYTHAFRPHIALSSWEKWVPWVYMALHGLVALMNLAGLGRTPVA